jgi:hypothetical protein
MAAGELELDAARNVSLLLPPWGGQETVDADLRASLFVALGAAVLSALIGIFAGVEFIWIVLRALLFGAVMGAAALGAVRLARGLLPGLVPDRPGEAVEKADSIFSAGAEEPMAGTRVDIVLPGGEAEPGAAVAGEPGAGGTDADQAEEAEFASLEAEAEADQGTDASLADEGERAPGAAAAVPAQPESPSREARPEGIEDLDVLPDLDGFTDSFAAAEFSSSGGGAQAPARPEAGSSSRSSDGLDPASLAKAVRTILKRDQKG